MKLDERRNESVKRVFLFWLLSFEYFLITTVVYFYSLKSGQSGVSLKVFGGGDDGIFYWNQIIEMFANNYVGQQYTSAYVPIVGHIVKFFGILDPYIVRLINYFIFIFFVIGVLQIISLIAKELNINKYKIQNVLLVVMMFYPSLIIYTNLSLYRDIWIYCLFIWSVLSVIIFFEKERVLAAISFAFFIVILYFFRPYASFSIITAVLLYILIRRVSKKNLILIGLIGLGILTIWYSFFKNTNIPILNMSLNDALEYREGSIAQQYNSGASDISFKLNQSNVLYFLIAYLYSFLTNLCGPLLWQMSSVTILATGLTEGIAIVFVVFSIISDTKKVNNISSGEQILICQSIVWIALISITNKNIGTGTRLRIPAIIFLLILCFILKYQLRSYDENLVN